MKDFSQYKGVGKTPNTVVYTLAADPDILIIVPQDAEARRVYQEIDTNLFYGGGLVVEKALSRALGSFFLGLPAQICPRDCSIL
jgi:hypothetical protein